MGFLNALMTELGKKTGKAIGNKLYGKYADDIRISYGNVNVKSKKKVNKKKRLLITLSIIVFLFLTFIAVYDYL